MCIILTTVIGFCVICILFAIICLVGEFDLGLVRNFDFFFVIVLLLTVSYLVGSIIQSIVG
jgi:hypothetical protein